MKDNPLVLVIDDDPFMRAFCQSVLTQGGYDVALADDAREGARLAETTSPAIVLLDHAMPDMTGLQFLGALIDTRPRRTPVIMISAWDCQAVRDHAERLGAVWLSKPVSPAKLLATVNDAIEAQAV